VGAACQAGLAVDLIVGLGATHLPACLPACLGGNSKACEPIAPILLEGLKTSCVPDLEQLVISLILGATVVNYTFYFQTFLDLHNVVFQCTLQVIYLTFSITSHCPPVWFTVTSPGFSCLDVGTGDRKSPLIIN